ncbi:homoserine kinase [Bacillus cereus group sp. BfR-BA-01380]|uniref:homoserine kinase n=1 Tax=Bacillus cereus group sp. BfR-BA-01380 TaxID=2920324 RepID=UPI001F55FAD6|nr:homoserine kinase [Bacillus cereus group sp. BfR-BA-01380]
MKAVPMFTIRVPASTANLGPGFDSIGLAVSKYLTVDVFSHSSWECTAKTTILQGIPKDEKNLLIQTARMTATRYNKELPYCHLHLDSDIPLARGLGSSASAIIAGIELADQLCELYLSRREKLLIATEMEGHIDNVGAALYGGLMIGTYDGKDISFLSQPIHDIELVAVIPSYELKTVHSRDVLPSTLPYIDGIRGSGVANVLVAALCKEDWVLAGEMMRQDMFHEPYRKELVPELQKLQELEHQYLYGVSLSGAGPTVLCYVKKGSAEEVKIWLQSIFSHCVVETLQVVNEGVHIISEKQKPIESI